MSTFVLIHSPLVGPMTWSLVANELQQHGHTVVVPKLNTTSAPPYWKQHVTAVVQSLAALPADQPVFLVAHSGAGMLLPAIRQEVAQRVAGYIFVDAGIPIDGWSRLDFFSPDEADQFRRAAVDGLIPLWSDEDLREVIPDSAVRRAFVAEFLPLPLAVYDEPIPVFEGWPDASCGYLLFTPTYTYGDSARFAQTAGWAYSELPGAHFHMLVAPGAVTTAIIELSDQMTARFG